MEDRQSFEAFVVGIYGAYYEISPIENCHIRLLAKPRGKLRLLSKNGKTLSSKLQFLAVGDVVVAEKQDSDSGVQASILSLYDRRNSYQRSHSSRVQTIATNIDRVYIITSVGQPVFQSGFIDRAIVEAAIAKIPVHIILNKMDLYDAQDPKCHNIQPTLGYLIKLGYPVSYESFRRSISPELKKILMKRSKNSLFLGQSGVGKSSLLNLVFKANIQQTQNVSLSNKKGKHTTTNPVLYSLKEKLNFIDVPGIREFGLAHREPKEISLGFPEFDVDTPCRFSDCLHLQEPDCVVQKLCQEGVIPSYRMDSYRSIINSLSAKHKHCRGDYRLG